MAYGILKSAVNSGLDSDLVSKFVAPLAVYSNSPSLTGDSLSLKRYTSRSPSQRWEIEARLEPTNNSAAFMVHSVLAGSSEVIFVRMPQVYGKAVVPSGSTPKLTSQAVAGATTAQVYGIASGGFPEGEFINFFGDSKVYMVVSHIGSTLEFYPPLRVTRAANTDILFGSLVTMRGIYDTSVVAGIKYTDGILADPGSVKVIEKL